MGTATSLPESKKPGAGRRWMLVMLGCCGLLLVIGIAIPTVSYSRAKFRRQRLEKVNDDVSIEWRESDLSLQFQSYGYPLPEFMERDLAEVDNVSIVIASKTGIPQEFFAYLSEFHHIRSFCWADKQYVDGVASVLQHQRGLTKLDLELANLLDDHLDSPALFANLEMLTINKQSADRGPRGTFLRHAILPARLKDLRLYLLKLDDIAYQNIGKLVSLESLDLQGCNLTSESANAFRSLIHLRHLDISNTDVDDAFVETIRSLVALEEINAYGCNFSADGLSALTDLAFSQPFILRSSKKNLR